MFGRFVFFKQLANGDFTPTVAAFVRHDDRIAIKVQLVRLPLQFNFAVLAGGDEAIKRGAILFDCLADDLLIVGDDGRCDVGRVCVRLS